MAKHNHATDVEVQGSSIGERVGNLWLSSPLPGGGVSWRFALLGDRTRAAELAAELNELEHDGASARFEAIRREALRARGVDPDAPMKRRRR